MSKDPYAHLDAAYLLDALSPDERAEYEAHLERCPSCRAALEESRRVLPYLAVADEDALDGLLDESVTPDILAPPAPETLLPGLLAAARRTRHRRTTLIGSLGAVAAACLTALVLLALPLLNNSLNNRPMTPIGTSPLSATVVLQPTAWGTEIEVTCWDRTDTASPDYRYGLTVRGTDGATYPLGDWQLGPGRKVTFSTGTALTASQISTLDITDVQGRQLLTYTN